MSNVTPLVLFGWCSIIVMLVVLLPLTIRRGQRIERRPSRVMARSAHIRTRKKLQSAARIRAQADRIRAQAAQRGR